MAITPPKTATLLKPGSLINFLNFSAISFLAFEEVMKKPLVKSIKIEVLPESSLPSFSPLSNKSVISGDFGGSASWTMLALRLY